MNRTAEKKNRPPISGGLVFLLTLASACVPALRAVRTDPTVALRHE